MVVDWSKKVCGDCEMVARGQSCFWHATRTSWCGAAVSSHVTRSWRRVPSSVFVLRSVSGQMFSTKWLTPCRHFLVASQQRHFGRVSKLLQPFEHVELEKLYMLFGDMHVGFSAEWALRSQTSLAPSAHDEHSQRSSVMAKAPAPLTSLRMRS